MKSKKLFLSLHTGILRNDPREYLHLVSEYMHWSTPNTECNKENPWNLDGIEPHDIILLNTFSKTRLEKKHPQASGKVFVTNYSKITPLSTDELYNVLTDHPDIQNTVQCVNKTIILLSYWTLCDLIDPDLVPDINWCLAKPIQKRRIYESRYTPFCRYWESEHKENPTYDSDEMDLPELDYYLGDASDEEERKRRPFVPTTLSEEKKIWLRQWIQSLPSLHVECADTDAVNWDIRQNARHAGILRTFPNITDLNYSSCDKCGDTFMDISRDIWFRWGIRTASVVRYHGSDDWCFKGEWSNEARYLQVCQEGHSGVWNELHHPTFQDVLQYMNFRNPIPLTNQVLQDMAYFQNLVFMDNKYDEASFEIVLSKSEFNEANERTFLLPAMPELMRIDVGLVLKKDPADPLDPTTTYTVYLDIENSPNLLRDPSVWNEEINVRVVIRRLWETETHT